MIELLDMGATGVIGVRISGRIDKPDVDRVAAAVKATFGEADKLRVYVEVKNFDGIAFQALLVDLRFAIPNLGRLRKKAVVSETKRMETSVVLANRLFPNAEIRHFPLDQAAEAKAWVRS